MDLEGSDRLTANKVGANDELVKNLTATSTSEHFQLFDLL